MASAPLVTVVHEVVVLDQTPSDGRCSLVATHNLDIPIRDALRAHATSTLSPTSATTTTTTTTSAASPPPPASAARDINKSATAPVNCPGLALLVLLDPVGDASLSLNENSDPAVREDLATAACRRCPHEPARAVTFGSSSLLLPLDTGGHLSLGTWQGLYLCDWSPSYSPARRRRFTLGVTVVTSPACSLTKALFKPPSRGHHSLVPAASRVLRSAADKAEPPGSVAAPDGLACVMVRHCSASVSHVEDREVAAQLEPALGVVVPDAWSGKHFEHTYEGWDDMPGHAKNALMGGPCALLPCSPGRRLMLDDREDVVLGEHRDDWGSGGRNISVTHLPGCFRAAQPLSIPGGGSPVAKVPAAALSPGGSTLTSGFVIARGPSMCFFVVVPPSVDAAELHAQLLSQRCTSDEYLAAKWRSSGRPQPHLGPILRSLVFGRGRSITLAVRDSALWVPAQSSVCIFSAVENTPLPDQVPISLMWFGI
ncbi:hypothetical protein Pelo_9673 [Pelomyxa schiedti]|nr:hypothetical protein Pelo_9673 [Pelomyxa schiedti]